jgi:hypothetical protein
MGFARGPLGRVPCRADRLTSWGLKMGRGFWSYPHRGHRLGNRSFVLKAAEAGLEKPIST